MQPLQKHQSLLTESRVELDLQSTYSEVKLFKPLGLVTGAMEGDIGRRRNGEGFPTSNTPQQYSISSLVDYFCKHCRNSVNQPFGANCPVKKCVHLFTAPTYRNFTCRSSSATKNSNLQCIKCILFFEG